NAEYPTPQKLLDGLFGKIAFDPLAFARMKARDQLGALLEVVDLGLDLDTLAVERKVLFDNRTDVNREAKRLEGAIAKLPPWNEDRVPDELVSAVDLISQLEELSAKTAQAVRADNSRRRLSAEIGAAEAKLESLHAEYNNLENDAQNIGLWDDEIAALHAQVANAEEVNACVRVKKQYFELEGQLHAAHGAMQSVTAQIQAIDDRKTTALASATFPVPGLSFNEDGVLYDGRPLEQASSAELTRISTAVAMAANPKLKVVIIHDGSLLDDDNLHIIAEMAAADGYQIWIERVDESGEVGVIIEDGMVVATAGSAGRPAKKDTK
ncbi:MAG TPA: hypothetical protein VMX79_10410, partial [bacterium]|nr:hypothetical protein [bacterium]